MLIQVLIYIQLGFSYVNMIWPPKKLFLIFRYAMRQRLIHSNYVFAKCNSISDKSDNTKLMIYTSYYSLVIFNVMVSVIAGSVGNYESMKYSHIQYVYLKQN